VTKEDVAAASVEEMDDKRIEKIKVD